MLRDEIESALSLIKPRLRGLVDLVNSGMPQVVRDQIMEAIVIYTRRQDLSMNALRAIDALIKDGYPDLEKFTLERSDWEIVNQEVECIESALEQFLQSPGGAEQVVVTLGPPSKKELGLDDADS